MPLLSSIDIRGCAGNSQLCDRNANCMDTPESFSCACNNGFSGNGTSCSGRKLFPIVILGEGSRVRALGHGALLGCSWVMRVKLCDQL